MNNVIWAFATHLFYEVSPHAASAANEVVAVAYLTTTDTATVELFTIGD
jgi:hypothetical protein